MSSSSSILPISSLLSAAFHNSSCSCPLPLFHSCFPYPGVSWCLYRHIITLWHCYFLSKRVSVSLFCFVLSLPIRICPFQCTLVESTVTKSPVQLSFLATTIFCPLLFTVYPYFYLSLYIPPVSFCFVVSLPIFVRQNTLTLKHLSDTQQEHTRSMTSVLIDLHPHLSILLCIVFLFFSVSPFYSSISHPSDPIPLSPSAYTQRVMDR